MEGRLVRKVWMVWRVWRVFRWTALAVVKLCIDLEDTYGVPLDRLVDADRHFTSCLPMELFVALSLS